ncbi:hypothetical protein EV363DRAFT_1299816 [Boletus edulis]|nr:hypothetical protein EV363DRAFT_1299816 [Boletus edulis]
MRSTMTMRRDVPTTTAVADSMGGVGLMDRMRKFEAEQERREKKALSSCRNCANGTVVTDAYGLWLTAQLFQIRTVLGEPFCDTVTTDCLDRLPLPTTTVAAPIPTVTTGIVSLTYPDTDAILDIKPSVFLLPVDDLDDDEPPVIGYLDFEPYIARAWASSKQIRLSPKAPSFTSTESRCHWAGPAVPVLAQPQLPKKSSLRQ